MILVMIRIATMVALRNAAAGDVVLRNVAKNLARKRRRIPVAKSRRRMTTIVRVAKKRRIRVAPNAKNKRKILVVPNVENPNP